MVRSSAPEVAAARGRDLLDRVLAGRRHDPVTHVEHVPPRPGRPADWPDWAPELLVDRFRARGIVRPWEHQAAAATLAHAGQSVVISTGTASGKSLAYQLPVLSTLLTDGKTTALYLSPTKALAADQLRSLRSLVLPDIRAAAFDGDTEPSERDWVRAHSRLVLTNPDMLHRGILPSHPRWATFLRRLRYVVVDECHTYRGVFGSHVAHVLRRLRRICASYGAYPTFVLASATVASPAISGRRLTGLDVEEVTDDASPRGSTAFALWEPPLTEAHGEHGAPVRRAAGAEAARLLADLVVEDARALAFVRSRRGAEVLALTTRRHLASAAPELADRVAAYRAGYLPEERRALEAALANGTLLGVAATNALELGIDISGLDAVLLGGFPGTRAALWQQVGRAGRTAGDALAVMVARDDPLDTYLVHHPESLFGRPVEATVFDPDNPYVLGPHLCAAAAESPLTDDGLALFGPAAREAVDALTAAGLLRRRTHGWYWTDRRRACDLADIRSSGGAPVRLVEDVTGRVLGTVDHAASHGSAHVGAVYLHQGESYVVLDLDLAESVAIVSRADVDYSTSAREVTDIEIVAEHRHETWGRARLSFGAVRVTHQVVSYLKRRQPGGEVLGEHPLDLPARTLETAAVWWTLPGDVLEDSGIDPQDLPGAAHAAEHAAIGLLPLFATCDRWDIGGVSTARHPDTGQLTVFVHDGHPGGAGFSERGFQTAADWLAATREAISSCGCADGCPSCVQSPKCGNQNNPLDKAGAVRLLDLLLAGAPRE